MSMDAAWRLRHWAGSGRRWSPGAWRLVTSAFVLCGRRGAYGTGLALMTALVGAGRLERGLSCVAGVSLGDICLRFVWQAWRLVTSAFVLCGRRGTYGTVLALVTALVGAGRLGRRASFAWQAWHVTTSAFVLCGRRGAYGTGLALGRRASFVWQAWRLTTSAFVLCGRRGTW
eukprot:s1410_g7.t1